MEKSGEVRVGKGGKKGKGIEKKSRNRRESSSGESSGRTRREFRPATIRGICHPHVTCRGEPLLLCLFPVVHRYRGSCFVSGNFGAGPALYFRNYLDLDFRNFWRVSTGV